MRVRLRWMFTGLAVLLIIGMIASPLIYRSLPPRQRDRIDQILPFMSIFAPQREYAADVLPTLNPDTYDPSAADDLLSSLSSDGEDSTPTVDPGNGDVIAGSDTSEDASPTPTSSSEAPVVPPTTTMIPTEAPAATLLPTETPLPTATWTPLPPPTQAPQAALPSSVRLYGFTHNYQTWNNCGPATLTMGLSYYSWQGDQANAAAYLKPDVEDKNVSPGQMVHFVNENTGIRAITRMGGDMDMIRRLLFNDFPVIVETGYMPEGYDWMGHYRLVVAYDDTLGQFYAYDSFLGHDNGNGLAVSYDLFDDRWQHFNRTYIVIYEQSRESELSQILGDNADLTLNAQHALQVAQQEAAASPEDPFAWFNVGTSYLEMEMYDEAARAYDRARNAGSGLPWRMLWYQFGPFEAYYEVGRYDDVLALVQANLNTTPYVEETYYWTGRVYQANSQVDAARNQYNLALQHNSNFIPAQEAIAQLDTAQATGGG